jgi:hypothetical protein
MKTNERLCRPMCGRSLTFRLSSELSWGLCPRIGAEPLILNRPGAGKAEPFRTSGGKAAEQLWTS